MSGEELPSTPADLARTLREAADRLMSGWTSALTGPFGSSAARDGGPEAEGPAGAGRGGGGSGDAAGSADPAGPVEAAGSHDAAASGRKGVPRGASGTDRATAGVPVWPGGGAAVPGLPGLAALLGPLVPPATLSARQLQAVLDDLGARRAQVEALRTQLGLFDEQLAALETSLGPVLEWTRAWAGMEQTMTDLWRPPSP